MLCEAGYTPKGSWACIVCRSDKWTDKERRGLTEKNTAEDFSDNFWLLHPAQAERKELGHHYDDT
jgi:hypothetical protein